MTTNTTGPAVDDVATWLEQAGYTIKDRKKSSGNGRLMASHGAVQIKANQRPDGAWDLVDVTQPGVSDSDPHKFTSQKTFASALCALVEDQVVRVVRTDTRVSTTECQERGCGGGVEWVTSGQDLLLQSCGPQASTPFGGPTVT